MSSLLAALIVILAYWLIHHLRRRRLHLQGPPSPSFLFGHTKQISSSRRPGDLFDFWTHEYGSVYRIRGPLGSTRLVLCDPRAIAHVFARDSWRYSHPPILQLRELIKMVRIFLIFPRLCLPVTHACADRPGEPVGIHWGIPQSVSGHLMPLWGRL
jgi:hypothetical protein